jgi:predicted Zn-ribbon and HTH transcriptional regulator
MSQNQPKLILLYFPDKWNEDQVNDAATVAKAAIQAVGDVSLIFLAPVDKPVIGEIINFSKEEFVDLLKRAKIADPELIELREENTCLKRMLGEIQERATQLKVVIPWTCPKCGFESDDYEPMAEHFKKCEGLRALKSKRRK